MLSFFICFAYTYFSSVENNNEPFNENEALERSSEDEALTQLVGIHFSLLINQSIFFNFIIVVMVYLHYYYHINQSMFGGKMY